MRAALEEVLSRLGPVKAPPALTGGLLLRPRQLFASTAVTDYQLETLPALHFLFRLVINRVRLMAM